MMAHVLDVDRGAAGNGTISGVPNEKGLVAARDQFGVSEGMHTGITDGEAVVAGKSTCGLESVVLKLIVAA